MMSSTSAYFSSIIANERIVNHKRMESMSMLLFSDDQLKLVQEGFHQLFHIIRDIVAKREPGARLPQKDLLEHLNKLETEKWQRIRMGILHSVCHDYTEGNFSEEESCMPVKVMYDMVATMDRIKEDITANIQDKFDTEVQLRNEMTDLHHTLEETQAQLRTVRWSYEEDKAALSTMRASVGRLEAVVAEKAELIAELKRQDNVNLWQKEKQRVLSKATDNEAELRTEIENLTKDRAALMKRIESVDKQLKLQRLKTEMAGTKSPSVEQSDSLKATTEELTQAKQHIYVLEKDLRSIESELFDQQKYMIGLLKGVKEDYWDTWNDVLDSEAVAMATIRQGRQLGLRLFRIFQAAAEGRLGAVRADLPDNYLAADQDIARVSIKKISSAYGVKLAVKTKLNTTPEETNGSDVDGSNPPRKQRSTLLPEGTLLGITRSGRRKSSILPDDHPELVNPKTGFVNMIKVMKFFPYMVKEYVTEQWHHFKTYDINGDGELDLTEMMNAMRNTVGNKFTAVQVRDAMLEVDIDGSETMDFFEYLNIAHLLLEKKGRSEVFRSKMAKADGRQMSKTCVVQ